MLRELIKSLYAIANAIKGNNSEDGGNSVEDNYIKFIQPVGIIHIVRNVISETSNISNIIIDEYESMNITSGGYLGNPNDIQNNNYYLVYNRVDIENGINNKFEYGHYYTGSITVPVYINYKNIEEPKSLIEFLQLIKPEQANPKFDEINSSVITESNLEDFVVVMARFENNPNK